MAKDRCLLRKVTYAKLCALINGQFILSVICIPALIFTIVYPIYYVIISNKRLSAINNGEFTVTVEYVQNKKCFVTGAAKGTSHLNYRFYLSDGSVFKMKEDNIYYSCFVPECSLKPKEKQYRPYTFMEFTDKFTVGQPIKFRQKGAEGYERYLILNGYQHEQHDGRAVTYIYIGSQGYTLDALFNDYEWQEHYTEDFKPFGVEEEK